MYKLKLILAAAVFPLISFSQPILLGDTEISEITKEIQSIEIKKGVQAPSFIQYIQKGRRTPSCTLFSLDFKSRIDIIKFDSGDEDDYSNCNKIYPPVIVVNQTVNYAVFRYLEEETKGSLINNYFTVRVVGNEFKECENNEEISRKIVQAKSKTKDEIRKIISALGCK